jgi:ABC-2 type transport system permease protein
VSTAVVTTPATTGRASGLGGAPATGTGALLRFGLRREGIPIAAWVAGIGAITLSTIAAFAKLYPDADARAAFARSLGGQPAFAVLTGKIFDSSLGGLTAWRVTLLGGLLAALMSIFTVIRRTRADEEAGRTELLVSTAVGRAAPLLAALSCALTGCVAIAVLVGGTLAIGGEDFTGSVALGLTIGSCGLLFAGVAAVAAQLFDGARPAIGIAGAALGVSFGIRAVADAGGDGSAWLRWLSPLGWAEEVRSFAADRFWVIGLMLLMTISLTGLALWLLGRRDVGLGLFPTGLGPAVGALRSPFGLAGRLHRPSAVGWTAALALFGLVTGSIVDSAKDLFADNRQMSELLAKIGGQGAITGAVLNGLVGMSAVLAGIAAVAAAGRMVTEESSDRAALILATPVSRIRWQATHLLYVIMVPVLMLAVAGVSCGIMHGIRSGDFGGGFSDSMVAMLGQIPACWVIGAVAVLVHAEAPRFWAASWVVLVAAVLLAQLGPILQLPQWANDLSPFLHVGMIATAGVPWTAEAILASIAVVLLVVGCAGFARRDLGSH